jgi:hypothetical protein
VRTCVLACVRVSVFMRVSGEVRHLVPQSLAFLLHFLCDPLNVDTLLLHKTCEQWRAASQILQPSLMRECRERARWREVAIDFKTPTPCRSRLYFIFANCCSSSQPAQRQNMAIGFNYCSMCLMIIYICDHCSILTNFISANSVERDGEGEKS